MAKRARTRHLGVACAMISGGVVAMTPQLARSQEAPPPIAVPTDPVAQTPPPASPKPPPPAATPKPAPPPPATPPTSAPATTGSTTATAPPPPKYNNEGTFKVGGVPVVIGAGSGTTAKPPPTPPAKTNWKAPAKAAAGVVAQWPGFRMTDDGGSELMVEFSKALPTPTEHKAAGSITYVFHGAHVTKFNNENPLLTKHFNTPVFSAKLVPKGFDLHFVVELRPGVDVTPVVGQRAATDNVGQQFFVKFGKGSYLPPDDDVEVKAPNAKSEEGAKGTKTNAPKTPSSPPPPPPPGGLKMGPKP